jgi:hypothetical protein
MWLELCAILCPAVYASMRCERAIATSVEQMLQVSRWGALAVGLMCLFNGCVLPAAISWERTSMLSAPRIGLQLVTAALMWTCGWMFLYGVIHL